MLGKLKAKKGRKPMGRVPSNNPGPPVKWSPHVDETLQPRSELSLPQRGRRLLALSGSRVSSRVEGGGARWEGGGSLFSTGPGSHYFHVADWGMERGGIMSRRYSRWRSTAEEVLCTVKLGLTNARAPPATEQSNRPQQPQSGGGSWEDPSLSWAH